MWIRNLNESRSRTGHSLENCFVIWWNYWNNCSTIFFRLEIHLTAAFCCCTNGRFLFPLVRPADEGKSAHRRRAWEWAIVVKPRPPLPAPPTPPKVAPRIKMAVDWTNFIKKEIRKKTFHIINFHANWLGNFLIHLNFMLIHLTSSNFWKIVKKSSRINFHFWKILEHFFTFLDY